jgi:PhnB protein
MSIKSVRPYLIFGGNAEQAIGLYERALGAKTEGLMRFGEIPASGHPRAPEDKQRVVHALVRLGAETVMVSDTPTSMEAPKDGNVHICMDFEDPHDMTRKFEALAESGRVVMGIQDTFWGAKFGSLVDAYGIHWMFNCMHKPE